MILVVEILFILLLSLILFLLYRRDGLHGKGASRSAMLEECWTGKERRQHARFKDSIPISYRSRKRPQMRSSGKTIDLSMGGLKLLLDEKLSKGAILFLHMVLPESNKPIEAECEIVWSEEADGRDPHGRRMFHAGVRFLVVKSPHDSYLLEYIRSLPQTAED